MLKLSTKRYTLSGRKLLNSYYRMSSVLRSIAQIPRQQSKFIHIESPSYSDSGLGYSILFPFTLNKGILDIAYIDSFKADMVDTTNQDPSVDNDTVIKIMGGNELITDLGENFKSYITAWRNPDAGAPISIYQTGTMQKVQMSHNFFADNDAWATSSTPPSNDGYVYGDFSNSYRTVWVFKQPLTFTTIESGVTQYITFNTRFNED